MKSLREFVESNNINLLGLPEEIKSRLSNLNGQPISECCCGPSLGCCYDKEAKINTAEFGNQQIVWFYSENEIVLRLKECPKVSDVLNMHRQFNRQFTYSGDATPGRVDDPLYFKEWLPIEYMQSIDNSNIYYKNNTALYKFVTKLEKEHELKDPVVLDRVGDKLQLFFIVFAGTNGKEGSIKSSLVQAVQLMNALEEYKEIEKTQILDVAIDNADDVYTFLVTFEIDKRKFM